MKKLTSEDLMSIQTVLTRHLQSQLDQCDFKEVSKLSLVLAKVDYNRREKWHKEKFGAYEKMADEVFTTDDIPF